MDTAELRRLLRASVAALQDDGDEASELPPFRSSSAAAGVASRSLARSAGLAPALAVRRASTGGAPAAGVALGGGGGGSHRRPASAGGGRHRGDARAARMGARRARRTLNDLRLQSGAGLAPCARSGGLHFDEDAELGDVSDLRELLEVSWRSALDVLHSDAGVAAAWAPFVLVSEEEQALLLRRVARSGASGGRRQRRRERMRAAAARDASAAAARDAGAAEARDAGAAVENGAFDGVAAGALSDAEMAVSPLTTAARASDPVTPLTPAAEGAASAANTPAADARATVAATEPVVVATNSPAAAPMSTAPPLPATRLTARDLHDKPGSAPSPLPSASTSRAARARLLASRQRFRRLDRRVRGVLADKRRAPSLTPFVAAVERRVAPVRWGEGDPACTPSTLDGARVGNGGSGTPCADVAAGAPPGVCLAELNGLQRLIVHGVAQWYALASVSQVAPDGTVWIVVRQPRRGVSAAPPRRGDGGATKGPGAAAAGEVDSLADYVTGCRSCDMSVL